MTRNRNAFRPRLESLEDRAVPATFTVNTTLDEVTPGNGKQSLREAINRANTTDGADVVVVPAGVYKIQLAPLLGGDFDITDTLTIQGAGAGKTVVDGQQLDRVFDVAGSAPSSTKVVFQGLTIRNGNVAGDGGGIRVGNADLVVRDCAVTGNRASLTGGGISDGAEPGTGDVRVVRTRVARNVAGTNGGGIFAVSSPLTVNESRVRRNLASAGGGGIYASTATLTSSTVSGNTANQGGGVNAGTVTLSGCTVSGNAASTSGGGISTGGTVTLINSTVSGNTAGTGGGGISAFVANVTKSTVSGNTAGGGGGVSATAVTLTNSTVSGNNAAGNGGGINAESAVLTNCTVVENSAHTGGGVFHDSGGGFAGPFSVMNTIIALNLVDFTGAGPDVSGLFTSEGHNLIGIGAFLSGFANGVNGDIVGTATNPIDPKLGPLANNGGRTKTHALLAGSKAIDAGDNAGVPPTDQRGFGFARKKDGNGDGLARVDIGAFEK